MENKSKLFKKADLTLILLIVIICIAFLLPRFMSKEDSLTAVLYHNGEVIKTIDLKNVNEPYEFDFSFEHSATVRVEKGKIRYLNADCPDKICVNTGWLSHHGDTASCLPSRTVITVEGNSGEDVMAY